MKLKSGLLSHQIDTQYVTVASGEAGAVFNGMIRSNQTAMEILQMLEHDMTEEQLVEELCARYDAPQEVIAADVHGIVDQIRMAGLLDE